MIIHEYCCMEKPKHQFADIEDYRIESVIEPILHNIEVADGITSFPATNTFMVLGRGLMIQRYILLYRDAAYGTTESEELRWKEAHQFCGSL